MQPRNSPHLVDEPGSRCDGVSQSASTPPSNDTHGTNANLAPALVGGGVSVVPPADDSWGCQGCPVAATAVDINQVERVCAAANSLSPPSPAACISALPGEVGPDVASGISRWAVWR